MTLEKRCSPMWDKIALILLIIGGINWGLVGIFELDLVAWMLGGAGSLAARAVLLFSMLFAPRRRVSSVATTTMAWKGTTE